MSTTPWGTMNGWLRLEAEQRGKWQQLRVQDLRAAQVAGRAEQATAKTVPAAPRLIPAAGRREPAPTLGCSEAA